MDPVTHGIAGALIGKAFFANDASAPHLRGREVHPHSSATASTARVAIFAATLGAVFPDADVFVDALSHDPLGIARYHRGFTHSFVGLPIFALALAWLTRLFFRWYSARRGRKHADWTPPSFALLFVIYAAGIASHILLDALTNFGTRIFNPFSKDRVAWDCLFIIDFVFTALLLVPQLAAWAHRRREACQKRAAATWTFLTILALGAWSLARAAQFPFSFGAVIFASAIFAAALSLPIQHRNGAPFSRTAWCRAGFALSCAYILATGIAHHAAISRVRAFAAQNRVSAQNIGAMPMPLSFLRWNGVILTRAGVYQSFFSLGGPAAQFKFWRSSPPNRYTQEALMLEPVRTYLWYARFPVTHFTSGGGEYFVWYSDLRYFTGEGRPTPFTFYVSFDSDGEMLKYGWVRTEDQLGAATSSDAP
jgi:membrane-bound metal-dependent hydrolase YbcI (DUF457 family)